MKVNNDNESNEKALLEISDIVDNFCLTDKEKLEKISEAIKVNKNEKEMFDNEMQKRHQYFFNKNK